MPRVIDQPNSYWLTYSTSFASINVIPQYIACEIKEPNPNQTLSPFCVGGTGHETIVYMGVHLVP